MTSGGHWLHTEGQMVSHRQLGAIGYVCIVLNKVGGDIMLTQLSLGNCPSMAIEPLIRARNVIWNRSFLRTSNDPGAGLFDLVLRK